MQPTRLSPRLLLAAISLVAASTALVSAPSPDETSRLAARAQTALNTDLPAEALADFRHLEKLAATPDATASARRGQHAALSALYRQEQHRALLLPAHRALLSAPSSALAWWNWTRACLAVGSVNEINSARAAIEKLASLPDTTAELRLEIARSATSPDTAPPLVNEILALLEPTLPPADADDASLTPDQRDARALHNHFMSVWTQTNRTQPLRSDEESELLATDAAPAPLTPAERTRLHATIRQASDLLARTRPQTETRLSAANAARDALLQSLADGQPAALDLVAPFDATLAAYDPYVHSRQLTQARQRLTRLFADPSPENTPDDIVTLAQSTIEELEFRALAASDLRAARAAATPALALLAERRELVPPAADAPAEAHAAHLERLNAFLARDWPLTRAETRAQARALLALEAPLSAAAVLHASLALAPDRPSPEDQSLLRAIQDRSTAFARTAESAAASGDLTTALDAWREAARLDPGDPAAWRALLRAARSVEGAEPLAVEAAGRLWQLDAISREEIFAAGSLALLLGQPDWTHVLLSRLPDGGAAHLDTQLLRALHADRHFRGPLREQEFTQLRRLLPPADCLRALGQAPYGEPGLTWAPLKRLREKLPAPANPKTAPANKLPPIPVLGDPVLARYDSARRPDLLPHDFRDSAARAASRHAAEAEARRLLAADPLAAALEWARAASALGEPITFQPFAAELAPALTARPELLPALATLPAPALDALKRDVLHPLPDDERNRLFTAHLESANQRLQTDAATTARANLRQLYGQYFTTLGQVGALLKSPAASDARQLALDGVKLIPQGIDSIYAYLFAIPESAHATAVTLTLPESTRAEVRSRAGKQIAAYNKEVDGQYTQQLKLGADFSDEIVGQALSVIWSLPADHPDRKIVANLNTPVEQKREVVARYAKPIQERAANRTVGELAITAAQNGSGSWADAEKAARRAGGDTYARYLASAPNVPLAQIQTALRSGTVSSGWVSRLQQTSLDLSLQIERDARARAAEFQARTGGGRYDINKTVYNSRYDSTGAGYQSYEKAMRRELDRLYPTGR